MSEKQELVKADDVGSLVPANKYDDKAFDAAASSTAFLPRLQLNTASSKLCKAGKFPINHYALVRDQKNDDLGENLDVFIADWHPKALETGDAVISDFDPESDEFARIQKKSFLKNSGCMFGPEFLCWIPSIKTFATFFMGTKSARREAGNVKSRLHKAATLGSQFCKNKDFEWYAPECSACSTPFEMPEKTVLLEAVEKFRNPPKSDVEGVKEEEVEESRAR